MEATISVPLIIGGMAVITFAIRFLPLVGLASLKLPEFVDIWLRNVTIAILAAMLFQSILVIKGQLLSGWDFRLLGAVVSIITIVLTRNLLLTVIAGTAVVVIATILS